MAIMLIGLLIGSCLVLAGGFAMLRAAFMRLSHGELPMAMIERQDKILSALIVGQMFFVLSAVILITHYLLGGLNNWQIALHCVILTLVIVPVTDVFPRSFIVKQPHEFSLALLPWIRIAAGVFNYPAKLLVFLGRSRANFFNTTEYYPLVSRYYESNATNNTDERKDYDIQKILSRFITLPVTDIMTKASDLKVMDVEMPVEELITAIFESNASRVLLYQDRAENIVGILHTSLLMKSFCLAEGDKNLTDITSAISEPVFISDQICVFDQLQDFSSRHEQYALIRDRNGVLLGAIAMETILEKSFSELKQQTLNN
jgi:Mg2+/Co2+ transporter CorB